MVADQGMARGDGGTGGDRRPAKIVHLDMGTLYRANKSLQLAGDLIKEVGILRHNITKRMEAQNIGGRKY